MSEFNEQWLEPGSVVMVTPENVGALIREIQRLRLKLNPPSWKVESPHLEKVEVSPELIRVMKKCWEETSHVPIGKEHNELRDDFAGRAMAAMLNTELRKDLWASVEKIALDAYKMADAMLKARSE